MMSQRANISISAAREPFFQRVRGRLATMLLEYARHGTTGIPGLSQREMAELLGTPWELVNESLRSLHEEGAIRIERHRIIIKEESLQKIAGVSWPECQRR